MDAWRRGSSTRFSRTARTRRMLERMREGWVYRDVTREEGFSERRVRQIVAEHVKRSESVDGEVLRRLPPSGADGRPRRNSRLQIFRRSSPVTH